ncbi:hypothetical protein [Bacillus sp. 165]|uniref:tetratricopeptide repeat protein n=1 Tax=Bacillus sp. 165 TaxID=1529117 RepID=UPI001ADAA394|nr:hypothetical protein [Bacillus sp. 165]MBO9128541.1 hypothetical protein [Bacillus sp. 165]
MTKYKDQILKVQDFYDNEEYTKVIRLCGRLIKEYPEYPDAYFERAMARMGQGKDKQALPDFEKVLKMTSDYPGAKDWYARALSSSSEPYKAAEAKLASNREDGLNKHAMGISPWSWAECAQYFYDAGAKERAEEVLQEYFREYAHAVTHYACYSTAPLRVYTALHLDKGDIKGALGIAEQARFHEHYVPADWELWIKVLALNGEPEKALEELRIYINQELGGKEFDGILELRAEILAMRI